MGRGATSSPSTSATPRSSCHDQSGASAPARFAARRSRSSASRRPPELRTEPRCSVVLLWLLLCQVERAVGRVAGDHRAGGCDDRRALRGVAGRRLQEPVDAADEVALEGSAGFAAGLAFGLFALEERLGLGGVAGPCERGAGEGAG